MVADLSGNAVMGFEWSLLALAIFLVAVRLVVRLHIQHRKLLLSDILLVLSVLDALALIICDTESYKLGAMSGGAFTDADSGVSTSQSEKEEEVALAKYSFASNYFYDSGIYFPKFTILAFYLQLFPVTKPRLRGTLYFVSAFTITAFLCTVFLDTFWCGVNVSSNWSTEPDACSTFNSIQVFRIDWSLNIASDLMIFFLPFPLLRELKLRTRQIAGLGVTFALGAITMAVSIARFISVQETDLYNTLYVWSMAEMAVAIIVVALPALSSLLYRRGRSSTNGSNRANSHYINTSGTRSQRMPKKLASSTSGEYATSRSFGNRADDSGSDIELNPVKRGSDGIHKLEEVSVDSHAVDGWEEQAKEVRWNSQQEPKPVVGYTVGAWSKKDSGDI